MLLGAKAHADAIAQRTITVTGSADVRVPPDQVQIVVGIESKGATIEKAQGDNDERVKRVLEVARSEAIPDQHIQTDFVQVEPWYKGSGDDYRQVGYIARKSISITLGDIRKFEGLFHKLLNAGVTHVDSVDFRTTDLRKHKDAARKLAITAAREKAADLASVLDQGIGRPVSVQEIRNTGSWYAGWGAFSRWRGGMSNVNRFIESPGAGVDMSTMALGQITVSAEVTVCFELRDGAEE
jgi:hypothetical protein